VRRDDGCRPTVKGNDNDGWSFDGVVLRVWGRKNEMEGEWWGEWVRLG
jgi:hypothetical protein